jgi:hypothetical protein
VTRPANHRADFSTQSRQGAGKTGKLFAAPRLCALALKFGDQLGENGASGNGCSRNMDIEQLMSARAALTASGALPENVNYAVKSSFLLSFLESVPAVSAKLKEPNTAERKFEDVVRSATSVTTTISLDGQASTDEKYIGLDNVSVVPIPEPGTFALFGGSGLLALVGWRRFRKA